MSADLINESHLLQQANLGSSEALNILLDKYKNQAYSMALSIVRIEADAEDVVQNAFIKVFRHLHEFKKESKFSTWLYRIVYNESMRFIRMNRRFLNQETDLTETDMSHYVVNDALSRLLADERKRLIRQAMQKLSGSEYTILTLFYLEEKSIRELKQITGFTKANIRVILHRARKRLYQTLNTMLQQEVTSIL